jgi:hypothetical protein
MKTMIAQLVSLLWQRNIVMPLQKHTLVTMIMSSLTAKTKLGA